MEFVDLEKMKYSDLQKLAKSHGIKANQKSQKLAEALGRAINICPVDEEKSEELEENDGVPIGPASNDSCESNYLGLQNTKKTKHEPKNSTPDSSKKRPAKSDGPHRQLGTTSSPKDLWTKKCGGPKKSPPPLTTRCTDELSAKPSDRVGSVNKRSAKKSFVEVERRSTEGKLASFPVRRRRPRESSEDEMEPMRKRLRSSCEKEKEKDESTRKKQTTNIPRYEKLLKKTEKKTVDAQYWMKIHQKNQDKMESIDEYQKKKKHRTALLLSSSKSKTKQIQIGSRRSPRFTKTFLPQVMSTDKLDLNFNKMKSPVNKNLENKLNSTFVKEPSGGIFSPRVSKRGSVVAKETDSTVKMKSTVSPKLMNSTLSASSNLRPRFDLAASLERPLSWVPYSGKLRPLHEEKTSFRVDPKEVKTRSRQERREQARVDWKSKRVSELMNKRGLKV